jgi:hypothetical protein
MQAGKQPAAHVAATDTKVIILLPAHAALAPQDAQEGSSSQAAANGTAQQQQQQDWQMDVKAAKQAIIKVRPSQWVCCWYRCFWFGPS